MHLCPVGWALTCFRERRAHSSKVSAASSFPWRRYRAPRFLRVVFTVGLQGEGCRNRVRTQPLPSTHRPCTSLSATKQWKRTGRKGRERAESRREGGWDQEAGLKSLKDSPSDPWQLTCSLCRPCTTLRTLHRVPHCPGAGSGDENRKMLGGRWARAEVQTGSGKAWCIEGWARK